MLKFEVKNQRLTRLDRFRAAEDSVNYLMAEFDILTDDWDGATITATFSNGEKNIDVVLIENRCTVPWEILGKPVLAKVSLFGVKGDKIITTDICSFSLASTLERGSSGKDPTPDAYQQIVNMIEAGKVKGPKGDPGPQGDPGPKGEPGQDGHTPVKGVDYWTASDKQEIYAEAEQALRDQEQSSVAAIRTAGAAEVGKVQAKGTEVLASIPDDYSALVQEVDEQKSNVSALNSEIAEVKTNVEELAESLWKMEISGKLDGTAKTYHRTMKTWFNERGVNAMSPIGITDLCDKWYRITRDEWNGWTTFYKTSTSSEGVRGGDNADMVCEASTDTVENRDDFAGLPLFAVSTVNWELDADGDIVITAIKGISSSFEQDNPDKYVGVMQMSGYTYIRETDDDYTIGYASDNSNTEENCAPLPESIRLDGTVREFVVHAKYMSSTVGGKMTSCSGMIPTSFNSHNKLISLSANNGAMYSASTVTDWAFLVLMTMIKYASMTQDRKNQGCVSYNYQYTAALAESGVSRVLLSDAQTAKLVVGSCVVIGSGGATDRTDVRTRDISSGCTITSIEDVTVDDVTYKAVYVDADPFDTTTDTIISTWHWKTGTNDHVLGNDGSITSPSSGVYPAMIQGIEYSMGGYEVLGDVILSIEDGYYVPYIARRKEYQAASLNGNMHKSTLQSAQPAGDGWNYIKRLSYDGEIFFGTDTTGATSSTYTKDAFYKNGTGTVSGLREWLAFGGLSGGPAAGGLSSLFGASGLSPAAWSYLARLSPNGNRGELAA